jgi:pimeloyl-ACP methyl ester carboxylesterase
MVWGDPKKLSQSDVLRFQWPSIGSGWERGLLNFARAQASPGPQETDAELLQKVLQLENTTVSVICGSKDRVISPSMVRKFFQPYPQVRLVELEGLGHDPFEEDPELFLQTVEKLLEKSREE